MKTISTPRIGDFHPAGGFWKRVTDLVQNEVIPYQWDMLNDRVPGAVPSHCVKNFRIAAGESDGEYYGMVFQDSDLAKWLEAAAYSLSARRDPELEKTTDEVIRLIEKAQQPDGYLNTYFTAREPGRRWTNLRDCHELYCAGHMMEAAVAYYEATGKRKLLDVMTRMARHIDMVLGPEEGKLHGYPGHEEIELALIRMHQATGDPLMLKLARYFIDERGKKPNFFEQELKTRNGSQHFPLSELGDRYAQNHLPVREQDALEGHSVRALYLATGMADVARQTGDDTLAVACKRLFDNFIAHRMYVTGGVGSTEYGEAFTFDDDLPNDTVYAETCASVALCFFARALLQLEIDGRYADAMERALYNTVLAGMSLDGRNFFYVNPLEVWPEASRKDPRKKHVLPVRPMWFGCACCPPNLARLVMSLGRYAWGSSGREVYSHLFVAGNVEIETDAGKLRFQLHTGYPADGEMRYVMPVGRYGFNVRVPGWAKGSYSLTLNGAPVEAALQNGYALVEREWAEGDRLTLTLPLCPRRVYASPRVREDIGKVAVMRGPLVYCLEEADNGRLLPALSLDAGTELSEEWLPDKLNGIVEIRGCGTRAVEDGGALYGDCPPRRTPAELTFIPYYAWANRGEGEMRVWVSER
jgi:DUF1680 family protein